MKSTQKKKKKNRKKNAKEKVKMWKQTNKAVQITALWIMKEWEKGTPSPPPLN